MYPYEFSTFDELDDYLLGQDGYIIHQIWFRLSYGSKKLFKKYAKHRATWRLQNPRWCYLIWNEKLAKEFMKKKFPEFLELFNHYKYHIQRVDALRYFILYEYGGWYADMDMDCLKPLDEARKYYPYNLYLVETPNTAMGTKVSNLLMFSTPKHLFWKKLFIELEKSKESTWFLTKHIEVMYSTGPCFLNRVYSKYQFGMRISTLPSRYFNPHGLSNDVFVPPKDLFTLHIGAGSWENSDSKVLIFFYCNYKLVLFIVGIMLIPMILGIINLCLKKSQKIEKQ